MNLNVLGVASSQNRLYYNRVEAEWCHACSQTHPIANEGN